MIRFYQGVILVLIGIILFLQFCNRPKPCPDQVVKADTIVRIDTHWIAAENYVPAYVPKIKKSVITLSEGDAQGYGVSHQSSLVNVIGDHDYTHKPDVNIYEDTLETGYGPVIVKDTVANNILAGRSWSSHLSLPVITRDSTIIKTVREEKRTQVYLGIEIVGRPSMLISDFGPSATIITKRNQLIKGSALWNANGGWGGSVTTQFLLSFKKRR